MFVLYSGRRDQAKGWCAVHKTVTNIHKISETWKTISFIKQEDEDDKTELEINVH
jgi:hypothetical protein